MNLFWGYKIQRGFCSKCKDKRFKEWLVSHPNALTGEGHFVIPELKGEYDDIRCGIQYETTVIRFDNLKTGFLFLCKDCLREALQLMESGYLDK